MSKRLLYVTESRELLDILNHVHLLPSSGALEHGMRMLLFSHKGENLKSISFLYEYYRIFVGPNVWVFFISEFTVLLATLTLVNIFN